MRIAPVSTNLKTDYSPLGDNNAIKLLEKQKMQMQEQIQKVRASKMDDKTKQEKIKSIQDQIEQINMEIQQRRSEMLNQNKNTNQENKSKQSNTDASEDNSNSADMSQLVQASTTYSQAKIIHRIKNSLNGKSNVLKIEIELDSGRGGDPKRKIADLHDTESRKQMLDKKESETLSTTRKQVKEASRTESKTKDINNNVKNEETSDTENTAINDYVSNQNEISVNNEENSQPQGMKGIDKNYKRVNVRV
ncbi:FlxA-like family protein [Candidatus Clostridium radicumherbarum]|uniref:FlxA-like family protein n=1 Tax=Candidatus Clostridium radicumherbarum TaxID=3381662 RepID=A0ABW8TS10_9CLOT